MVMPSEPSHKMSSIYLIVTKNKKQDWEKTETDNKNQYTSDPLIGFNKHRLFFKLRWCFQEHRWQITEHYQVSGIFKKESNGNSRSKK